MEKNTEEILIRYISGESSPEEQHIVLERFKTDINFRWEYAVLRDMWFCAGLPKNDGKNYQKEMDQIFRRTVEMVSRPHPLFRRVMVSAAAAVVLLSLSIGYFFYQNRPDMLDDEYVVCEVPRGERSRIVLPDSSVVWLNGGSQVRYAKDFNRKDRLIELDGEAYFEVAKCQGKDFIVEVDDLQVRVFGTKFNVSGYREDEKIVTSLDEGSVALYLKSASDTGFIRLKPNEKMIFTRADRKFQKEIFSDARSWKDGYLAFYQDDLENMVRKIERRYDVKIKMESVKKNNYLYTGTFSDESLQDILEAINFLTPIDYCVEGKEVKICFR